MLVEVKGLRVFLEVSEGIAACVKVFFGGAFGVMRAA